MATRGGKQNTVENKVGAFIPRIKIIRVGGQAKTIAGKLTKRGDS